jgi:hypothetical protein
MSSKRNAWGANRLTPRAWVYSTSTARVSLDVDENWNRVRVIVEERTRPGRPFRKGRVKWCARDLEAIMVVGVPPLFRRVVASFLEHLKRARLAAGKPNTALVVEAPEYRVPNLEALEEAGLRVVSLDERMCDDSARLDPFLAGDDALAGTWLGGSW